MGDHRAQIVGVGGGDRLGRAPAGAHVSAVADDDDLRVGGGAADRIQRLAPLRPLAVDADLEFVDPAPAIALTTGD